MPKFLIQVSAKIDLVLVVEGADRYAAVAKARGTRDALVPYGATESTVKALGTVMASGQVAKDCGDYTVFGGDTLRAP